MFLIFQSDLYFLSIIINWKKQKSSSSEYDPFQRVQLNQYYFALYYLLLILFFLNTLTDYNAFLIIFAILPLLRQDSVEKEAFELATQQFINKNMENNINVHNSVESPIIIDYNRTESVLRGIRGVVRGKSRAYSAPHTRTEPSRHFTEPGSTHTHTHTHTNAHVRVWRPWS